MRPGLLTGSARVTQEGKDATAAHEARQEIERKEFLLKRRRKALEAQIAALQLELETETQESRQLTAQENLRLTTFEQDRDKMAHSRFVKPGHQPGNGRSALKTWRRKMMKKSDNGDGASQDGRDGKWDLKLYVAGQTPKSLLAFANLKRICKNIWPDSYQIEVVDLRSNPQLAKGDQILALPTLVRRLPHPVRKIVGDLSNTERVLVGLGHTATESVRFCEA